MSFIDTVAKKLGSLFVTYLALHLELTLFAEWHDIHELTVSKWIGYPLIVSALWLCIHILIWNRK